MNNSDPVVHFLYEPGSGGLDRVAILLANGMAKRGISTELWLTKADGPVAHLIASNVKIRMVPTPRIGGRGLQLFLQIPAVAGMMRKHRPRAIFSAGNQTNLSLVIARKLAGDIPTKIIQKITNPVLRPGFSHWVKAYRTWRFGLTARLGDMSLTLSAADAENYAQTYPRAADKFHAVPNPYVHADMLASGEHRIARAPGLAPRLLAVGRIAPQKGYLTLISALARIADRPWSMTILGDGPLLDEAKRFTKKLGLADRIEFRGFVEDVTPYFSQSDILVLSSRWEGFPAVPIEAMATGCAVVATDCSAGLTQLLNQIGQHTVPVHDPEALAKAISNEIDSPQPIEPLRACATAYSIENSVEDHLKLLQQVCGTS
ncbi:glycosyltransferase [Parasphingorhabdus sp.]|uniref:glycosyltransferase n=1 Tax=Parasphingorhabdus sp. TaxID=2709688 RepID=UPI0032EF0343